MARIHHFLVVLMDGSQLADTSWMDAGKRDERGFTLIELMVVVLIIAVLLAIAIPSFLGARDRANDRRTQSNLRIAHTNELVWFADNNTSPFTDDVPSLRGLDASIAWTDDFADIDTVDGSVYVKLVDVIGEDSVVRPGVIVGSRSRTETCYWIRAVATQDHPRFAKNDCSAEPTSFGTKW
jgi:prepilin-type N-terminal cleavage/methylation domain-containing protein